MSGHIRRRQCAVSIRRIATCVKISADARLRRPVFGFRAPQCGALALRKVSEMRANGMANPTHEDAAGLPRYAQVANDLMERIAAGEYPIGSLLPKEVDLSAE